MGMSVQSADAIDHCYCNSCTVPNPQATPITTSGISSVVCTDLTGLLLQSQTASNLPKVVS